jgi:hypothetical protein
MSDEIFRFEIATEQAAQNLSQVEAQLKNINKERKELIDRIAKGEQLNAKEQAQLTKLTTESKRLSTEKRTLNREVDIGNKLNEKNVSAYDKLNAQLARNRNEYRNLAAAKQQDSARGKQLLAQIQQQDKQLKGIDASMGQHQRNVGDYQNSIVSAFQQMGIPVSGFTKLLALQTTVQGALQKATLKTSGAMKILKLALISTGIGAIVVVLGALAAAFLSTQGGVDKLNKVLIPLRTVFERIWGLIQDLGGGMIKAFSDPKKAITDLWEFIKSQVLNRLQGIIDMFTAVGKVIKSVLKLNFDDAKDAAKDFGNAYLQTLTGVEDFAEKAGKAIKGLGDEIGQAAKEGQRLADIKVELEELAIEIARNEGRINREYSENYSILSNVNKSMEEQLAAGQKAIQAAEQLRDYELQRVELQLEQAQLKRKQNDTDRDIQREIAVLEAGRDKIQAEHLNKVRRLERRLNRIIKQQRELNKELLKFNMTLIDEAVEYELKKTEELLKEKDLLRDEAFEKEMEDEAKRIEERHKKLTDAQKYISQFRQQTIFEELEAEQNRIDELRAEGSISEEQHAMASKRIQKDKFGFQMEMAANVMGNIAELLGEETRAGKLAASAMTAINTYQSIMKTLAMYGWTPLGIAGMVSTAAVGAVQIAKINKTPDKFADGGIIGGQLHSQGGTTFVGSDGSRFEAEKGELLAIVNRRDTEMLSALSQANSVHGKSFFADGGVFAPGAMAGTEAETVTQIVRALKDQRVYVLENDITQKQKHVQVIENRGDI